MAPVSKRAPWILCLCGSIAVSAGAGETPKVNPRHLIDAEFIARDAELVVEATAGKRVERSSRVEFEIRTVIKGTTDAFPLIVDLAKAPLGRWPKEGETAILCLAGGAEGAYVLQSNHASIIPSVGGVRDTVAGWFGRSGRAPAGEEPATSVKPDATPDAAKPPGPSAASDDPYVALAKTCDAVLIGSVSKIKASTDDRFGASASFGVAEALYGFAGYPGPIAILLPPAEADDKPPVEGWHVGFFKEVSTGEGLLALSMVRLVGGGEDEKLKVRVKEAVGSRKGELTTVGATLCLWERAWNRRDLDMVIRCYAKRSRFRRNYNAGGKRRERLAKQVEGLGGSVSVSFSKIEPAGDDAVDVSATIDYVARGRTSRKEAPMRFVREGGDWRILIEDLNRK